jgi:hypothetical protein
VAIPFSGVFPLGLEIRPHFVSFVASCKKPSEKVLIQP